MYNYECPCCGADKWEFHWGAFEPGHRFGGSEPHYGYCSSCGFHYQEHMGHPMEEQVKKYKKFHNIKEKL